MNVPQNLTFKKFLNMGKVGRNNLMEVLANIFAVIIAVGREGNRRQEYCSARNCDTIKKKKSRREDNVLGWLIGRCVP